MRVRPSSSDQVLTGRASRPAGHPSTFNLAVLALVTSLVTGPVFGFRDTWLLVINRT